MVASLRNRASAQASLSPTETIPTATVVTSIHAHSPLHVDHHWVPSNQTDPQPPRHTVLMLFVVLLSALSMKQRRSACMVFSVGTFLARATCCKVVAEKGLGAYCPKLTLPSECAMHHEPQIPLWVNDLPQNAVMGRKPSAQPRPLPNVL